MELSVVICTYNPSPDVLQKVLQGLKDQTFQQHLWELILVDNCSTTPVSEKIDLRWHPSAKVIVEKNPGLSHARMAGVMETKAPVIVFVDDDNVLDENYLQISYDFSQSHPQVGCFGGRSLPVFSSKPPSWFRETGINLGCQDYGSALHISNYALKDFEMTAYPEKAPIGTGMVIQKAAFLTYLREAATDPVRMKLGRRATSLSSGEDNDIILTIVKKGFEIAYVPQLIVHHLIPANRYSQTYLEQMAFASNRTWVKVLHIHGINPYKRIGRWSVLPRTIRSYIAHKAWLSPLQKISWKASAGTFKGLSEL